MTADKTTPSREPRCNLCNAILASGKCHWSMATLLNKACFPEGCPLTTSPAPPDHGESTAQQLIEQLADPLLLDETIITVEEAFHKGWDAGCAATKEQISSRVLTMNNAVWPDGDSALRRISAAPENTSPKPQSHEDNVMFDIAIIATSHQPDDAQFSISFKDLRRLNATIKSLEASLASNATPAAARAEWMGEITPEVMERLAEAMNRHAIYDGCAASVVRPDDLHKAITFIESLS